MGRRVSVAVLSLALLLLSFLAYLRHWGPHGGAGWLGVCWCLRAVATRTRERRGVPAGAGSPMCICIEGASIASRGLTSRWGTHDFSGRGPFLLVAIGTVFVESRARELATRGSRPGPRLTLAATAPFTYLWRTLAPVRLSPLDPLPLEAGFAWVPLVPALLALALMTMGLWSVRGRYAGLAVAWAAYLLLLAPVAGLTPSGQQATADQYMRARSRPLALHRRR